MEEDNYIIRNIIRHGIRNGYMKLDSKKSIDMKEGKWVMSDGRDLGSTWDIILSTEFAETFWGDNFQDNLLKIVVMNSDERIDYLKQFVEDYSEIKEEEVEEIIETGLKGLIQVSLRRIKEHSEELYKESCISTYEELNPIVEKTSVTELVELDFFVLNYSDQIMMGNLSEYLNDIGKASFTLCPECGCNDFTHIDGCSIVRKTEDYFLSQNEGC